MSSRGSVLLTGQQFRDDGPMKTGKYFVPIALNPEPTKCDHLSTASIANFLFLWLPISPFTPKYAYMHTHTHWQNTSYPKHNPISCHPNSSRLLTVLSMTEEQKWMSHFGKNLFDLQNFSMCRGSRSAHTCLELRTKFGAKVHHFMKTSLASD